MRGKEFDEWNKDKKRIHGRLSTPYVHRREIWWVSLGVNIGSEQDGGGIEYRRPALVLAVFGRTTCLVAPLTTSARVHHLRPCIGNVDGKNAHVLLSQIRVIDTKRCIRKVGMLPSNAFDLIRTTVRGIL